MSNVHTSTLRRVAATSLIAALLVTACGGDDDAATPQEQLVDDMADALGQIGGLDVDKDCVATKVDELTAEQVTAMSDALENNTDAPADLADWNSSVGDECLSVS